MAFIAINSLISKTWDYEKISDINVNLKTCLSCGLDDEDNELYEMFLCSQLLLTVSRKALFPWYPVCHPERIQSLPPDE